MLSDDEMVAALTGVKDNPTPRPQEGVVYDHQFFQADYEYTSRRTPYEAPEQVLTFRCGWVGSHPETGKSVAFGFMHNDDLGWGGTGMGPEQWDWGWTCNGPWPLAGETR